MRFFLASKIKDPNSIEKLENYINGFKDKKIIYIPTAANAEDGWESWKNGETWNLIRKIAPQTISLQLEDYRNMSAVSEILRINPNILWFAGGYPGYLAYWIRRCQLDKYLPKILDKGTLYVGSSAGAMVAGNSLQVATFGFTDNERGADSIKPLGLVNFDVFPHYKDKLFSKIKGKYKGNKLYLLKDGEEIIVEDSKVTVIGEERIIKND